MVSWFGQCMMVFGRQPWGQSFPLPPGLCRKVPWSAYLKVMSPGFSRHHLTKAGPPVPLSPSPGGANRHLPRRGLGQGIPGRARRWLEPWNHVAKGQHHHRSSVLTDNANSHHTLHSKWDISNDPLGQVSFIYSLFILYYI